MKFIGYVTTTILVLFLSYLWKGFVLSYLWKWFMVNPFGFNIIDIPEAVGISLLIGILTTNHIPKKEEGDYLEIIFKGFLSGVTLYTLIFGISWIVTFFM